MRSKIISVFIVFLLLIVDYSLSNDNLITAQDKLFGPKKPTTYIYDVIFGLELVKVDRPMYAVEKYGEPKITNETIKEKYISNFEDGIVKIALSLSVSRFQISIENKSDKTIHILWDEAAFADENKSCHRVIHTGIKYENITTQQVPSVIIKGCMINDMITPSDNLHYSLKSGEEALNYKYSLLGLTKSNVTVAEEKLSDSYSLMEIGKIARIDGELDDWLEKPIFPVRGTIDDDNIEAIKYKSGNSKKHLYQAFFDEMSQYEYSDIKESADKYIGKIIQILLPLKIDGITNEYIFTFEIKGIEVKKVIELETLLERMKNVSK